MKNGDVIIETMKEVLLIKKHGPVCHSMPDCGLFLVDKKSMMGGFAFKLGDLGRIGIQSGTARFVTLINWAEFVDWCLENGYSVYHPLL